MSLNWCFFLPAFPRVLSMSSTVSWSLKSGDSFEVNFASHPGFTSDPASRHCLIPISIPFRLFNRPSNSCRSRPAFLTSLAKRYPLTLKSNIAIVPARTDRGSPILSRVYGNMFCSVGIDREGTRKGVRRFFQESAITESTERMQRRKNQTNNPSSHVIIWGWGPLTGAWFWAATFPGFFPEWLSNVAQIIRMRQLRHGFLQSVSAPKHRAIQRIDIKGV